MSIFCDGACKGNGQKGAVAGWAFGYWPGPGPVHGEPATAAHAPLQGKDHTNQRAELTALLESLRYVTAPTKIYSDSMYAMNCASVWGPAWAKKDWTRSSGEPLQNLDLIKPLVATYLQKKSMVTLHHVKGHQTGSSPEAWGNNWVDKAAVAASLGAVREAIPVQPTQSVQTTQSIQTPTSVPRPFQQNAKIQGDLRAWFS